MRRYCVDVTVSLWLFLGGTLRGSDLATNVCGVQFIQNYFYLYVNIEGDARNKSISPNRYAMLVWVRV